MPEFQLNKVVLAFHPGTGVLHFDEDNKKVEFEDAKGVKIVLASKDDPAVRVSWSPISSREASLQLYMSGYDSAEVLKIKLEKDGKDDLNGEDAIKKKNGNAYKIIPRFFRLSGISSKDEENIRSFFRNSFNLTLEPELWNVRGGNYGQLDVSKLKRSVQIKSHDNVDEVAIEIPLANVSQVAVPGKNDLEIQYNPSTGAGNDRSGRFELSLVRLYVSEEDLNLENLGDGNARPTDDADGEEENDGALGKLQAKMKEITDLYEEADEASLGLVCSIDEEWCNFANPKGKYRVDVYREFFRMRGKTYDYKIPYDTIIQMNLLEHPEMLSKFLVISLKTPVRAGQRKYPYLVMTISDDEGELELNLTEAEIQERYPESSLSKKMSGKMPEQIAKLLKAVSKCKVFVLPKAEGFFAAKGKGEDPDAKAARGVKCSFKTNQGYLFPMKHSMMFLHNPVLSIPYKNVDAVEFTRGTLAGGKTFDLKLTLNETAGTGLTTKECEFIQFARVQFNPLRKFFDDVKVTIKNKNKIDSLFDDIDPVSGKKRLQTILNLGEDEGDDEGDEDDSEFDADEFKKKPKKQKTDGGDGEDKDEDEDDEDEDDDDDSSGGSGVSSDEEDEDTDMAEEVSVDSDELRAVLGETVVEGKRKRKAVSSEKKKSSSKKVKKASSDTSPKKAKKDPNAPKGAKNAYMLFNQEKQHELKAMGASEGKTMGEVAKIVGELWKQADEATKSRFEELAAKDKERYEKEMEQYRKDHPEAALALSPNKKKKAKKQRNPNEPKKPIGSYFYFVEEQNPLLKESIPDFKERNKKIAELWKGLTDSEKEKFNDLARKDKERYLKEKEEYEAKFGSLNAGQAKDTTTSGGSKKKKTTTGGAAELPSDDSSSSSDDSSSSEDDSSPEDKSSSEDDE